MPLMNMRTMITKNTTIKDMSTKGMTMMSINTAHSPLNISSTVKPSISSNRSIPNGSNISQAQRKSKPMC
ncbi:Uncharacterised protein [Vibrio cholerae]|nr:Uncharacterised protein [Vibrio cholerae]